ncbi:MAG: protein phosphatase 2C domain-containing protein [Pleurocapsa minor GSE-CHR-MK-17-07R]|nr:protein phosphatase 2C domain-containing protein [Pleurocapsa minor GSE-CHR-MK 17-07R]
MSNQPLNAPAIRATWLSITGSVREHNEDAVGIFQGNKFHAYVLCDGVGGAEAGEFVSEFAIKRMLKAMHETPGTPDTNWSAVMANALQHINAEVRRASEAASVKAGKTIMMGSTMVCVVIQGWNAFVLHVGDSRLYHWRAGGIVQATNDHSTSGTMMMAAVNPDGSVKRNVLMRGIGKSGDIEPDMLLISLQPGDKLLMCSDGMSDKISSDEIASALANMPLAEAPFNLSQLADTRMSRDNISLIIIEANDVPALPVNVPAQERAFVGYNPRWSTTFRTDGVSVEVDGAEVSSGGGDSGGSKTGLYIGIAVAVLVAIVALIALASSGALRQANVGSDTATDAAATLAIIATEEVAATSAPSPTDLPTETPTHTPTPTETPTPTATPIPPTATLRTSN